MTYKEYVLKVHPEATTEINSIGVKGCPIDYGLDTCCADFKSCSACWGQKVPDSYLPPKLKVMLDPGAIMPTRAHTLDAGLDLFSREEAVIHPNSAAVFNTGVHVAIPAGYVGFLKSKSGLNVKHSIQSEGVIDSGYTGSILVKLFNHGSAAVHIQKGQKISQLVLLPIITPEPELVDSLDETERGDGGFGSTGKF